jgi:putative two-component system response regulator
MDVMMPDMSGYEAVRLLNADPVTRKIPIVVMTAQNFDESTIQLLKQEPNVINFLQKPFRKNEIRNIAAKTLEKVSKRP